MKEMVQFIGDGKLTIGIFTYTDPFSTISNVMANTTGMLTRADTRFEQDMRVMLEFTLIKEKVIPEKIIKQILRYVHKKLDPILIAEEI